MTDLPNDIDLLMDRIHTINAKPLPLPEDDLTDLIRAYRQLRELRATGAKPSRVAPKLTAKGIMEGLGFAAPEPKPQPKPTTGAVRRI